MHRRAVVLVCALVLLLGVLTEAAGPRPVGPPVVVQRTGQLVQSSMTLLQYETTFDQDLHYLDFIPCLGSPSCPMKPLPACLPCDYSLVGTSACGQSPSGPQCACPLKDALCNASTAFDRNDAAIRAISLETPLAFSLEPGPGNVWAYRTFRAYIPADNCAPIRVAVLMDFGCPVQLTASFNPHIGSDDPFPLPPHVRSYRSGMPLATICPESDAFGSGTLFIALGFLGGVPVSASLIVSLLAWSNTPSPASPLAPAPVAGTQPLQLAAPFNASSLSTFSIALSGPCPRLFGVYASLPQAENRADAQLYLTVRDMLNDTLYQWGDIGVTDAGLALSFCPSDISKQTVLCLDLAISSFLVSIDTITVYASTQPRNFMLPAVVPTAPQLRTSYTIAASIRLAARLACGSQIIGPVHSSSWSIANLVTQAEVFVLAPTPSAPPTWPLLPVGLSRSSGFLRLGTAPTLASEEYNSRMLVFVATALLRRPGDTSTLEAAFIPYTDYDKCQVLLTPSLVNANGEPVPIEPLPVARRDLPCDPAQLRAINAEIAERIERLNPDMPLIEATQLQADLDFLEWTDAWQGCLAATEALLGTREEMVIHETKICPSLDDWLSYYDPCCRPGPMINYGTCEARMREELVTTRSNTTTAVSLPAASCLATYLDSFPQLQDTDCSASVPATRVSFSGPQFAFGRCYASVFGDYGDGQPCTVDSDCASSPSDAIPSWCDKATRLCVQSLAASYRRVLSCFVNSSSSLLLWQLAMTIGIPPLSPGEPADRLVDPIIQTISANLNGDCTAETTPQWSQMRVESAMPPNCTLYCPRSPLVLSVYAMFPSCVAIASPTAEECMAINSGTYGAHHWTTVDACDTSPTYCNWNQSIRDSATCNARSSFCGLCYNSTYCVRFSPTTEQACASSLACQLASGSYVLLSGPNATTQCTQLAACSEPCWDSTTGQYRTCTSQYECENSGGTCVSADEVLWHVYPLSGQQLPGACIRALDMAHPCADTYWADMYNSTTHPAGCVVHTVGDAAECESLGWPGWFSRWAMPAHTATECHALGQPSITSFQGDMLPFYGASIFSPPLLGGESSCTSCTIGQCVDYFPWRAGRWLPGEVRPLKWVKPAMVPWLTWKPSMSLSAWDYYLAPALSISAQAYLASMEQCRFNRISPTLEAVACATNSNTTENATACLDLISSNLPVASGFVCYGDNLTIVAPVAADTPIRVSFSPTSSARCPLCPAATLSVVSVLRFIVPKATQQLSSYWLPPLSGPTPGTLEFADSRGAVVGSVAGDAIVIDIDGCGGFTTVEICFPPITTPPSLSSPLLDQSTLVLDFALGRVAKLNSLQPLGLQLNHSACGVLTSVPSGAMVVPVWRLPEFESASPAMLSSRGKAAVLVTATGYFVVTALACVVIAWLLATRRAEAFVLLPFYLSFLLGSASAIRAAYFLLLSRQSIGRHAVLDVALVELPTFLWFTATTLMGAFWLVLTRRSGLHAKRTLRHAVIGFTAVNLFMYAIFVVLLVLFALLDDEEEQVCQGRQLGVVDGRRRRAVYVAYQAIVAIVALVIGGPFGFVSRRLLRRIRSREDTREQLKATVTGLVMIAAMVAHAVLLLALALAATGMPELSLLLFIPEIIPAALLLGQLLPLPFVRRVFGSGTEEHDEWTRKLGLIQAPQDDDDGAAITQAPLVKRD